LPGCLEAVGLTSLRVDPFNFLVGRSPTRNSAIRLIGAVLAEQHDDWTAARRYLGLDVLARSRIALINTDETTI
jgi:putative transposase